MESEDCYCVIRGIPAQLHAADLREAFGHQVERSGFKCFHYKHRREKQGGTDLDSCSCLVRVTCSARAMLEQDYGERTWNELLDRQDLPGRVQLSLVPVEQIAGRRIPELLPPAALPMGNVGTPVSLIKQAIRESRMPPSLLRQLRLDFTRTKARKFGSVPPPVGRGLTTSRTAAAPPPVPASTSATASAPPGAAPVVVNPGQTARSHLKKQLRVLAGLAQSQKRDIDGVHDEHLAAATQQTLREANRFDGPDVTDRHMEEWDRHMAIHPETARERDKERLFEQDVSNPWDKAGADALVWHNDAYYWDKMKGDFEEETADDYDVDFSEHFGYGPGDRAAQELQQMRREGYAPKAGAWGRRHDPDLGGPNAAQEAYIQGIGQRLLRRHGWAPGQGVGRHPGITDPIEAQGQSRTRFGLGYDGDRRPTNASAQDTRPHESAVEDHDYLRIGSVYDRPSSKKT